MKINVLGINGITDCAQIGVTATSRLCIDVDLQDHEAETLFLQLWEYYGSEGIDKWASKDGHTFKKKVN